MKYLVLVLFLGPLAAQACLPTCLETLGNKKAKALAKRCQSVSKEKEICSPTTACELMEDEIKTVCEDMGLNKKAKIPAACAG